MSLVVLQGRAYVNFINSLKSEQTKYKYRQALLKFLSYTKLSLEEMLDLPIADTENIVIDYLLGLKKKDLSLGFIGLNFSALKHFYFMNDVRINKEKIGKFLGEPKKKNVDRGYTPEEIKSLMDIADLRFKVVISVLASTGIRIGALSSLKLSHLKKKGDVYKFTIYENTADEYITFCTPECTNYIDSYLDYRTRSGERLKKDSFLIREQFDINDFEQVRKEGRSITKDSMSNILHSLAIKAGLRKVNHNYTYRERKPVPLAHGFRKFWMHQAVNSKLNPEIREMLLGRRIGIASAYFKPTEDEMLDEYMKAVDNLTINPENRLKRKVTVLQERNDRLDKVLDRLDKLENELGIKI